MLRSGAQWIELGEKPTKYFLRMNERRKKEKDIHVLQDFDGEYITGNHDILQYCRKHYEEMYNSQNHDSQWGPRVNGFLSPGACPRLSQADSWL